MLKITSILCYVSKAPSQDLDDLLEDVSFVDIFDNPHAERKAVVHCTSTTSMKAMPLPPPKNRNGHNYHKALAKKSERSVDGATGEETSIACC